MAKPTDKPKKIKKTMDSSEIDMIPRFYNEDTYNKSSIIESLQKRHFSCSNQDGVIMIHFNKDDDNLSNKIREVEKFLDDNNYGSSWGYNFIQNNN